jgi:hypothetical protein
MLLPAAALPMLPAPATIALLAILLVYSARAAAIRSRFLGRNIRCPMCRRKLVWGDGDNDADPWCRVCGRHLGLRFALGRLRPSPTPPPNRPTPAWPPNGPNAADMRRMRTAAGGAARRRMRRAGTIAGGAAARLTDRAVRLN